MLRTLRKSLGGAALAALFALVPGSALAKGAPTLDVSGSTTGGFIQSDFTNMPQNHIVMLALSPNPGSNLYGPFSFSIGQPVVICTVGCATSNGRLSLTILLPRPIPEILRGRTFHFQGAGIDQLRRPNSIIMTNTDTFTFGA